MMKICMSVSNKLFLKEIIFLNIIGTIYLNLLHNTAV